MTAATNGTATAAFSRTFAGGVGGAATAVTYTGVAVTPGSQYLINVPAGGSVVVEYCEWGSSCANCELSRPARF